MRKVVACSRIHLSFFPPCFFSFESSGASWLLAAWLKSQLLSLVAFSFLCCFSSSVFYKDTCHWIQLPPGKPGMISSQKPNLVAFSKPIFQIGSYSWLPKVKTWACEWGFGVWQHGYSILTKNLHQPVSLYSVYPQNKSQRGVKVVNTFKLFTFFWIKHCFKKLLWMLLLHYSIF